MEGNFRTAINGFHRQDVVSYITEAAKNANAVKAERDILDSKLREQSQESERLSLELEAEKASSAELSRKNEALQKKLAALEAELKHSKAELAAQKEELELLKLDTEENNQTRQDIASLSSENTALKQDNQKLREQLKLSLDKAAEYDMLKERMLSLELNASRRAVEIEAEAKQEAESLLSSARLRADEMEQNRLAMLADYRTRFSALSETASELFVQLDGKLEAIRTQFGEIEADFDKSVELFSKEDNA